MTELQLQEYYAKLPKVEHSDSEDDLPLLPQIKLADQPVTHAPRHPRAPLQIAPEDEHARDLLEALERDSPTPETPVRHEVTTQPYVERVDIPAYEDDSLRFVRLTAALESDKENMDDPGRLVPDPFCPDTMPRLTAAERDAMVEEEQHWRRLYGQALLVQDPDDPDHWIQPSTGYCDSIVKTEVAPEEDIYA